MWALQPMTEAPVYKDHGQNETTHRRSVVNELRIIR